MINQQPNKYLENSIQTASPAQLLIMLYDGAIRFSKLAMEDIKKKEFIDAHLHIKKVQDIIHELIITLDHSSPVANGLIHLYDYFLNRLIEANVKKELEPLEEVIKHLLELKETWVQAAKIVNSSRPAAQHG